MVREPSNEDRVCKDRVKRSAFRCGQDGQEVFSSHLINRTLYTEEVKHFISERNGLWKISCRTLTFLLQIFECQCPCYMNCNHKNHIQYFSHFKKVLLRKNVLLFLIN